MKKITIIILLFLVGLTLIVPVLVSAKEPEKTDDSRYKIQVTYPDVPGAKTPTTGSATSLKAYIIYLYYAVLSLIGFAAVLFIVYGGIKYMLADTISSTEEAQKMIFGAISGLILAFASYLILNTINPNLVSLDGKLKPIDTGKPPVEETDCIPLGKECSPFGGESGARDCCEGGSCQSSGVGGVNSGYDAICK